MGERVTAIWWAAGLSCGWLLQFGGLLKLTTGLSSPLNDVPYLLSANILNDVPYFLSANILNDVPHFLSANML